MLFFNVTFCIGMQTSLFPLTNVWTPWTRYRLLHHIGLLSSSGYYHSRYHEMTQNRWKHNLLPASQGNVQLSSVVWEQHYHRISQTLEEWRVKFHTVNCFNFHYISIHFFILCQSVLPGLKIKYLITPLRWTIAEHACGLFEYQTYLKWKSNKWIIDYEIPLKLWNVNLHCLIRINIPSTCTNIFI